MKPSSGIRAFARIGAWVVAIVVALGYYGHVRAQSGVGSTVVPLRPLAPLSTVPVPAVFGLEGIVADKQSAIQLGKALFWDMQAGSDDVQACASCHFNAGADSRVNNDVNPGQNGGGTTFQIGVPLDGTMGPNHSYVAGTAASGFGGYHDGDFPFHKLADVNNSATLISDANDISGSQGVFPLQINQVVVGQVGGNGEVEPESNNGGQSSKGATSVGVSGGGAGYTQGPGGIVNNPNKGKPTTGGKSNGGNGNGNSNGNNSVIGTNPGDTTSVEQTTSVVDPIFSYPDPNNSTKRINTRRTTPRNTPSVVDAVFNYR